MYGARRPRRCRKRSVAGPEVPIRSYSAATRLRALAKLRRGSVWILRLVSRRAMQLGIHSKPISTYRFTACSDVLSCPVLSYSVLGILHDLTACSLRSSNPFLAAWCCNIWGAAGGQAAVQHDGLPQLQIAPNENRRAIRDRCGLGTYLLSDHASFLPLSSSRQAYQLLGWSITTTHTQPSV